VSAIEPLYVSAGFALYLNRRAILEGWDIELQLRRLDERLRGVATAVLAAAAVGLAVLLAPPPALAADKSAKQEIAEVLKAPEFQEYRDAKVWRDRREQKDRKREQPDLGFWSNLGLFLAEITEALVWIAVAVGIVGLALVLAAGARMARTRAAGLPSAGCAVRARARARVAARRRRGRGGRAGARGPAARSALAPLSRRALGAGAP
jgi:hypothetical protein